MMIFLGHKMDVALFVTVLLQRLGTKCVSITITHQGKSEAFFASIAIDISLEDTVKREALTCSLRHISISRKTTPAG